MDRGAWRATIHGVARSPTRLKHTLTQGDVGLGLSLVGSSPDLLMIGRMTLRGHLSNLSCTGLAPTLLSASQHRCFQIRWWVRRKRGGSGAGPGQGLLAPPLAGLSSPAHQPSSQARRNSSSAAAVSCEQPESVLFCVLENSWSDGNFFEVITSRSQLVAGRMI